MIKYKGGILCAFDPGKFNYAFCLLTAKGRILKVGMLVNTLTDMKDNKKFNFDIKGMKKEFKKFPKKKLRIVYERMVPRNFNLKGSTAELTNNSIGLMLGSFNCKFTCYSAALWKSFWNREDLWISNDSMPEHIFDALFIGLYYLIHNDYLTVKQTKSLLKSYESKDFGYYRYNGNWYKGERDASHHRGRRNSFGR